MTAIYFLHHSHAFPELGVDEEVDKLLGVYESPAKAEQAIENYRKLEGFSKYPDGFRIVQGKLDEEIWTPDQIPQASS